MSGEKEKKKSPWRFLFLTAAALGALELLGSGAAWLLSRFLGAAQGAASVGIIGGADGPTAIFVTYSEPPIWNILVPVLLVIVGIWGYLRLKGGKGKER